MLQMRPSELSSLNYLLYITLYNLEAKTEVLVEEMPTQIKHCVRTITKKEPGGSDSERVSRAFAICTAHFQNTGFLKKGTHELTAKGKKNEKRHRAEPEIKSKLRSYKRYLRLARKSRRDKNTSP